jgi:hypothetical protein
MTRNSSTSQKTHRTVSQFAASIALAVSLVACSDSGNAVVSAARSLFP